MDPRLHRHAWRTLGRDVAWNLHYNASRFNPQPRDFREAAKVLGISPSDAATAWNVFADDDVCAPKRIPYFGILR